MHRSIRIPIIFIYYWRNSEIRHRISPCTCGKILWRKLIDDNVAYIIKWQNGWFKARNVSGELIYAILMVLSKARFAISTHRCSERNRTPANDEITINRKNNVNALRIRCGRVQMRVLLLYSSDGDDQDDSDNGAFRSKFYFNPITATLSHKYSFAPYLSKNRDLFNLNTKTKI